MIYTDSIFLDSGAWSIFRLHVMKRGKKAEQSVGKHGRALEEQPFKVDYNYYDLRKGTEFRKYCDRYASFMKAMQGRVDYFANVDVIGNAERTWEVQEFFEHEHGLRPIPVIHCGTSLKYVDRYLEKGHEMIGLGGFAAGVGWKVMVSWCDKVFLHICPESNGYLPTVKVHGFAMTGLRGIRRWPWYSVDSTSWVIWPANGWLPLPRWSQTKGWRFDRPPVVVNVCPASSTRGKRHAHMDNVAPLIRDLLIRWLKEINVPMGSVDAEGKMKEFGVMSHHRARTSANLHYFDGLEKSFPKWPWPLGEEITGRRHLKGFGL